MVIRSWLYYPLTLTDQSMEGSDGMFPFYLPPNIKVRIDETSPHLPPLTERMNEEYLHIHMGSAP